MNLCVGLMFSIALNASGAEKIVHVIKGFELFRFFSFFQSFLRFRCWQVTGKINNLRTFSGR